MAEEKTWYLLYGGDSEDGRGPGHYIGRTTDEVEAKAHQESCRRNWYSTGYVLIVTDREATRAPEFWTPQTPESLREETRGLLVGNVLAHEIAVRGEARLYMYPGVYFSELQVRSMNRAIERLDAAEQRLREFDAESSRPPTADT